MRRFLLAGLATAALITASALGHAQAAPLGQAVHPARVGSAAAIQQVDYYWHHRRFHHRRWFHHHWQYY